MEHQLSTQDERTEPAEMRGKRILFVITKSNWGGAQSYVYTLATHFHEQGALVSVALGGTGAPGSEAGLLVTRLTQAGVCVVPLPHMARDIRAFQEFRSLLELVRVIRAERPDLLHLNSSKAGVLGSLAGRIAGVQRIIFTAHGWPHREPVGILARCVRWVGSWLTIMLAHAVIVVSNCDYNTAPVLYSRRRIKTIYNGVGSFDLLLRAEARKALGQRAPKLPESAPWLMMLAELHPNKGIDTAISALSMLTVHPDAVLVVLGEGAERSALMQQATALDVVGRVFLLGFVPEARTHLRAADLILMPSRKEGFPVALLEAGVAGLPVVASTVGGIPELITHDVTGLLVKPEDATTLAAHTTALLKNSVQATALGEAFQKKVLTTYTESAMVSGTATVYAA